MPQLPLNLSVTDPYSLSYFVPHSGVSEAVDVFEQCVSDLLADENGFRLLFVYGARGAGKTHLVEGYLEKARAYGIPPHRLHSFNINELDREDTVRAFVDCVESARSKGGFVVAEGSALPSGEGQLLPHVRSRLLSGYSVRVCYPQEIELRPLIIALLERRSLRLPEHSISHLLRWLPTDPLSFERIIRSIDEHALSERRRVGRGVISEILRHS